MIIEGEVVEPTSELGHPGTGYECAQAGIAHLLSKTLTTSRRRQKRLKIRCGRHYSSLPHLPPGIVGNRSALDIGRSPQGTAPD